VEMEIGKKGKGMKRGLPKNLLYALQLGLYKCYAFGVNIY
jgi:hypothetical protein